MGTKTTPGSFDAYAKASPDEPLFTLIGRDRHAGLLVRLWALMRHREGEDEAVVAEALRCADAMDAFARAAGKTPEDREDVLEVVTTGMVEHPEGFDHPCWCDLCLSYGD